MPKVSINNHKEEMSSRTWECNAHPSCGTSSAAPANQFETDSVRRLIGASSHYLFLPGGLRLLMSPTKTQCDTGRSGSGTAASGVRFSQVH